MKSLRGLVSGVVQGVGFRYFTRQIADSYGLNGWVKNLFDGRVEFFVQGDGDRIDEFVKKIKAGPGFGKVDSVKLFEEPEDKGLVGFDVRF
jgi:acylphosphatase